MSVWLTEKDFTLREAVQSGVTINVAFLQEIKQENIQFRQLIQTVANELRETKLAPNNVMELFYRVREELETYFALEEFYGYFDNAEITNPAVSTCARKLKDDHEVLFLSFNEIVELIEQIVYRETDAKMDSVLDLFSRFRIRLDRHEQAEMELMMRLCNEDIGVGD